ncbi:hypothetical protein NDU88_005230 [Pleurodeles waltl]|uniref:Uncharacterized protein n=1 Tax=Pleurodeles waltl TaxID=8319 RepID=A0AAV7QGM6_PLEWA|nr:hypothetical protein NDU88_005230 [Pleurodeles waltl]
MMRLLIKYTSKERARILEELDQITKEILMMVTQANFDELKINLDKQRIKYEEEITAKKQRNFLRDFKYYQSGRVLTFHRKYDYMYSEEYKEPVSDGGKGASGVNIHDSEESDISDSNLSDTTDAAHLRKIMGSDKSTNRANLFKQIWLLNQGRTDQKKDLFQSRGRGRGSRGRGRGTSQRKQEQEKEGPMPGRMNTRARTLT